jgi:hypothetical protein
LQTETGSQSALGGLVGADATAINERTFVFRRMHRRGQRRQHLLLVLSILSCIVAPLFMARLMAGQMEVEA